MRTMENLFQEKMCVPRPDSPKKRHFARPISITSPLRANLNPEAAATPHYKSVGGAM
jgi:hypothetical protein